MITPAIRYLQLGLQSLGYDPGAIDGWYGKNTNAAAVALYAAGPARQSEWALSTFRKGLIDLGYLGGAALGSYDADARAALGLVIDHDGAPAASWVSTEEILEPTKAVLREVTHSNVLLQGSANTVITGLMMHCAAVPGDWHVGKTNQEIFDAIHRMHTAPVSQGGRGWSDTGYHEIRFPDGECMAARPLSRYGAGAIGYNVGWKHVLMIERRTIDQTRLPEDYFYPETLAGMRQTVEEFGEQTRFERLAGHREVAAKLCPGFDVIDADWTDLAVA